MPSPRYFQQISFCRRDRGAQKTQMSCLWAPVGMSAVVAVSCISASVVPIHPIRGATTSLHVDGGISSLILSDGLYLAGSNLCCLFRSCVDSVFCGQCRPLHSEWEVHDSCVFRVRSGHNHTRSHLHRIDVTNASHCRYCGDIDEEETSIHVFSNCSALSPPYITSEAPSSPLFTSELHDFVLSPNKDPHLLPQFD